MASDEGEGETGSSDGRGALRRNPDADPVRLHREYVQQRLAGGALPTPQAYERALDQWNRLPGATRGAAAELHPAAGFQLPAEGEEFAAAALADPESYEGPLPATDPGDNRPYDRRQR